MPQAVGGREGPGSLPCLGPYISPSPWRLRAAVGNESLSWPTVLQAPLPSGPFYYHLPMSLPATGEASMVCVLSSPALGGH